MKAKTLLKWPVKILFIVVGAGVCWNGIVEFDHAATFIPLLRGLFWIIMSQFVIWAGLSYGE